ncbi:uncharacterized protein LOC129755651 [Uranotaenia lowii]|uniref:uncharacterized protein LOC129755651 n=1 Tax=Uranotaenia lowii TaxID=190385 RepID=UPI0024789FE8|nr:uncharacterized protein LOC129755651 [Uranotaenia lowii]
MSSIKLSYLICCLLISLIVTGTKSSAYAEQRELSEKGNDIERRAALVKRDLSPPPAFEVEEAEEGFPDQTDDDNDDEEEPKEEERPVNSDPWTGEVQQPHW